MAKNIFFFVDPMSYNNLALYDKLLLENLTPKPIFFFGNIKYEYKTSYDRHYKYIYSYSNKWRALKPLSYLLSQLILLYYIIKTRPSVIHFQWFKFPIVDYFLLKIISLFLNKVKIVYTVHNVLPHNTVNTHKYIYEKIYKIVHKIIIHDQYSKNILSKSFNIKPLKIHVIPHGILPIKKKKLFKNNCVWLIYSSTKKPSRSVIFKASSY